MTIGSLALIAAGAVAVAVFLSWEEEKVKAVVRETLEQREKWSVDSAHPDLKDQYVSKRELNGQLHKLDKRMDKMEAEQRAGFRTILERLPPQPRRPRRRTP